ncbi:MULTISPECIES: hypothetical protein [Nocardioides]|uniref:DUF4190 domain-containing protein n=1 Tax=Nocardioides vastitatis TaxID=2568655 RepID=A0ABW0Z972_9ACTN|nr:hypothetical protein [Nocardioides sp.]
MSDQPPAQNPYDPRPYQPYGTQGQVFGPPPDHPQAATVLVLGVLGMALCQVVAPFAWFIGSRVRREIAESGGRLGGQQMVTIGWVLGILGSCILILMTLGLLAYLAVLALAIGASAA